MVKLQTCAFCSAGKLHSHSQKLTPPGLFLLLSFSTCSVFAEQGAYDLPSLGEGLNTTVENRNLPSHQQLSPVAQYLKQLTHKQLTDNSAIYLAPKGLKLETQFSENMSSELVTKGNGEISFTFKFSF